MDDHQAVYWHQGMFLQPQHFQIADQQQQFQLRPLMASGLPHFWGVGELRLALTGLGHRTIEVQDAQLLFPDRSYIEYPGNAVICARSFDPALMQGEPCMTVYLGLKKRSAHDGNVMLAEDLPQAGSAATRYATLRNPPETADLYSDGPAAQVLTLLHVVRIFLEPEIAALHDYELIPVASLVRDGDSVKLSDTFIAPCYTIGASRYLTQMMHDIRDELAARARQLQAYKSPREMQKAEFDASYLVFLLALRSLNRVSPYLFHLSETKQAHPWLLYGALRQLIGELSSFSERFNMLGDAEDGSGGVAPYDHRNLRDCFMRARQLITQLLNEITVGPEFLASLTWRDGLCVGDLPRTFFGQRKRFYLVLRSEQNFEALADSVLREARLAATQEMAGLIGHALPGLELIHMALAPQGLPRRSHTCYFRIEQMSQQWDAVERSGSIALQWLDAPPDLQAEIVVLRS